MHPYRTSMPPAAPQPSPHPEELVVYALLVVIGAIPVVIALIVRGAFGTDATLGAAMIVIGALGLVLRRRPRRS